MTVPVGDYSQFEMTFSASLRSVGTACTMAGVGIYLHRRGLVAGDGKRTLAKISQQVTIPLFLFTKVVYCNQDWSDEPCPNIVRSLSDVWMLLLWPVYVVAWGLIVGYVGARLAGTPRSQIASVVAACAFGNSTGLPITLLTVVHANFPATTELGRIDPTLFLSVYLLTYPILQWSIGGWLLLAAPTTEVVITEESSSQEDSSTSTPLCSAGRSCDIPTGTMTDGTVSIPLRRSALDMIDTESMCQTSRRGIGVSNASLYVSTTDLERLHDPGAVLEGDRDPLHAASDPESRKEEESELLSVANPNIQFTGSPNYGLGSLYDTVHNILARVFQPPVIGAMLGIVVAATPLRGIFVDVVDRTSSAPLQWIFDALYPVGLAAVPLNMMILGINLSQSHLSSSPKTVLLSSKTMVSIVLGKMLVMPMIGVVSVIFCKQFLFDVPDDFDAAFYLVMIIVFITPTANNVMVMVELSGGGAREGIARVIAWEYAVAPILLSLTTTTAVGVASRWS